MVGTEILPNNMSPTPSRMLQDNLDNDHKQWYPPSIRHYTNFWPLLIWTLLPNLTFYLIVLGFRRKFATGATCQQRTLTPPDTWSCPTLGLACVLCRGQCLLNLSCFRTSEFPISLGSFLLPLTPLTEIMNLVYNHGHACWLVPICI